MDCKVAAGAPIPSDPDSLALNIDNQVSYSLGQDITTQISEMLCASPLYQGSPPAQLRRDKWQTSC
jgi:hypothetical protein